MERVFRDNGQELFFVACFIILLFRFKFGKTFFVGQGHVAVHLAVVQDVGFTVLQITEEAYSIAKTYDAEPEGGNEGHHTWYQ